MQPSKDKAKAVLNHHMRALIPQEGSQTKELVNDPDPRVNQ